VGSINFSADQHPYHISITCKTITTKICDDYFVVFYLWWELTGLEYLYAAVKFDALSQFLKHFSTDLLLLSER